eukprot:gnl/Spiro4/8718_TR4564_c0_g1_i1.p1 gnl/Spiro4/8718_TR4564_c0_g1~~gnl/Spiro4/8718_TR4564_c0_g1_i1.p1  ORF type:complete len:737 (-),score=204.35 gnl/Spiro4/8718_TR4564_c0_g1_i1:34-2244(-)
MPLVCWHNFFASYCGSCVLDGTNCIDLEPGTIVTCHHHNFTAQCLNCRVDGVNCRIQRISDVHYPLARIYSTHELTSEDVLRFIKENVVVRVHKDHKIEGSLALFLRPVHSTSPTLTAIAAQRQDITAPRPHNNQRQPELYLSWKPTPQERDDGVFVLVQAPSPSECEISSSPFETTPPDPSFFNDDLYKIMVPARDIRSIRRYTPAIGHAHVIIMMNKKWQKTTFPPLHFLDGGVHEFVNVLKQHTTLVRHNTDPNLLIAKDHLTSLHQEFTKLSDAPRPPKAEKEKSWKLLELFSNFTSNARKIVRKVVASGDHLVQSVTQQHPAPASPAAPSGAALPPPYPTPSPCASVGQTVAAIQPQQPGSAPPPVLPPPVFKGPAVTPPRSPLVSASGAVLRKAGAPTLSAQALDERVRALHQPRLTPVSAEEWRAFFDAEGRVINEASVRQRVFAGGCCAEIRGEAWRFLLDFYPFSSTTAERAALRAAKLAEYNTLKTQWTSITPMQERRFSKFRDRKSRVEKDVTRTDRTHPFFAGDTNPNLTTLNDILVTYAFYNFDIGYCQGMSDLLAPILFWVRDEAEAFWCFAGLMEVMEKNFHKDQNGMQQHLDAMQRLVERLLPDLFAYFQHKNCLSMYFCFRSLLINFKREFAFETIPLLWEPIWSKCLTDRFQLFIALAVLYLNRGVIMENQLEFDDMLKFVNDLANTMDANQVLETANALLLLYQQLPQQLHSSSKKK